MAFWSDGRDEGFVEAVENALDENLDRPAVVVVCVRGDIRLQSLNSAVVVWPVPFRPA
ncbi:MAG: hypothetical protein ACI9MR_001641 [Myxococcota bacterium]|jgi:hypothetical protein